MDHLYDAPNDDLAHSENTPLLRDQSVTYLLQYFHCILANLIAGHLGADDLAASSIGATTIAIFGSVFISGMATALDTCAQSYGSGDLTRVGLHIQKMVLMMAVTCIPISALFIMSPSLLPFIVKQPELAVKAGSFLRINLIGLPAIQGDFHSVMTIMVMCTPLNVLLSYTLSFTVDMGLDGAALGSSLSQIVRVAILLLYIAMFGQWSHKCWNGFSREALRNWGPMAGLSFAGSIALSTYHLAAQSILMTISIAAWHIPFSISVVSSYRIGNLVGADLVKTAKSAAAVHGLVFIAAGFLSATTTFLLRHRIPRLFTNDPRILQICEQTVVAVSLLQIAEALLCGTNGLLRGLGRQSFAAYVVLAVNYLGAVPISIWLELGSPHWGLMGFWAGLPTGMFVIVGIQALYMRLIKWEQCVDDAPARVES
ncbi:MATE efflux family protein [Dactylonectria macrodidyma]|uniref:MATE efflux family protein n=1 Tax=Dactylonectria macrodidyma TaxID=307937 RepID=A0A9P9E5X2_9HYPO|nr:MATE efflux family protein [Dactylonectria macrodidyma]